MGIPAALWIVGTLLTCRITAASQDGDLPGVCAPCSATLAPEAPCEGQRDECPFVFNLPPMTVNIPKQLMDLEKIVEELQLLKDSVDELRKMCKDCTVSQTENECAQEVEQDADKDREDRIWVNGNPKTKNADKKIWESERENNTRVINEERRKDGKSGVKDKVEQVVAAGKNLRITERKKSDGKQIERDGALKGAIDKTQSRIRNASQLQNRTIGKNNQQLWQDKMMDSKKQSEASDDMEDGRERVNPSDGQLERHKLQKNITLDEKNILDKNDDRKTYHQITIASSKKDQENVFKTTEEKTKPSTAQDKGNRDISDRHIWQDKHDKVDREERLEKMLSNINKSAEEPIDNDHPAWLDKSQVDQNQMETSRYGEGIEERGKTISSDVSDKERNASKTEESDRHVWRDETMETGSVERIKMSVDGGDDKGPEDQSEEMGQNNGNAKQPEREKPVKETGEELKGEKPLQKLREGESENRKVMEGTDLNSAGQTGVINSASGHKFIDLDQAVTLTSPPPFTTSHLTTDVKQGERKTAPNNERGSSNVHSSLDAEMDMNARDYKESKIVSGGEKVEDEEPTMSSKFRNKWTMKKVDKSDQQKPTKTTFNSGLLDTTSSTLNSDFKISKKPPPKGNHNDEDTKFEHTHLDEDLESVLKQATKTTPAINELYPSTSTPTSIISHFNTDATQGGWKTTDRAPSQSSHNEDNTNTELSSLDSQSSKSNLTTKVSSALDEYSSTSTASNAHFTTDVKQGGPKTTFKQPSQMNQKRKEGNTLHTNLDRLPKITGERSKTTIKIGASYTTSSTSTDAKSHLITDIKQEHRKKGKRPLSQSNYNEMDAKITSQPTRPLDEDVTSATPTSSNVNFIDTKHEQGKSNYSSSQNNQGGKDSDNMHSNLDKLTRISGNHSKTIFRSSTPTTPKSHFTKDIRQGQRKTGKELPPQSNYNKMHTKTRAKTASQPTRPLVKVPTRSTPTVSKSHFTTNVKPGHQEKSTPSPHTNQDENLKLLKSLAGAAKDTLTASNTHFGTDVKPGQQVPNHEASSQSNQDEKQSGTKHSSLDARSAKATSQPTTHASAEDANRSDPTASTSHITTHLEQGHKNSAKEPPAQSTFSEEESETRESGFDTQLAEATSQPITSATTEDATISTPTAFKQGHKKTAKELSNYNKDKDSEFEHISPEAQPATLTTRNPLAEDTTKSSFANSNSHFPTDLKQGLRKTPHRPPSRNVNKKDSNSEHSSLDAHLAKVTTQPTRAFPEDITTSVPPRTTTFRHNASFKDEIPSTTFTPQNSSPTTLPPTADNRLTAKKNMSSKMTQNQKPKLSPKQGTGMKPEANQRLKNPKNDRKPDQVPSPDTSAKNNQRQKPVTRPKVPPGKPPQRVQIPKSEQSGPSHRLQVKVNETDNQVPSAVQKQKPVLPIHTPALATSITGLLTDEHLTTNATSMPDERQPIHSEIDKSDKIGGKLANEGGQKSNQFIKKTGHKQNNTSSFTLNQSNQLSSEMNGTNQRIPGKTLNPKINQKPKQSKVLKVKTEHPKMEDSLLPKAKPKPEQAPKAKLPKETTNQYAGLKNSSKGLPVHKPQTKPLKPKAIPVTKIKPALKPKEHMLNTDMASTSGPIKLTTEKGTEFKSTTLNPETPRDLGTLSHDNTKGFTVSSDSRVTSDEGPQTTSPAPSIPLTTEPNKATQGSTTLPSISDFIKEEKATKLDKTDPTSPPRVQLRPTVRSVFSSTAPPAPGPRDPAVEATTPSARELRVKINQVAAFLNKSNQHSQGRPLDPGPWGHHEDKQEGEKTDKKDNKNPLIKPDTMVIRDCSDHILQGHTKSGLYLVAPDPKGGSFPVFCDMEVDGGGWTVFQRRQDGSVSFNRSWAEYQEGFGELKGGEFWQGNNMIHLLTHRAMELRVELEDFEGVQAYAHYKLFKVASERMRYRLTVGGYSGTAGDALRFSSEYDHNNRAFTTPDRDNDRYSSGNCGAYYSSGWWFDACMASNLNGRYYKGRYKGVRDGIYWGTWHNISSEYYPTNERQSFKTVRMMIRPKGFKQ